MRATSGQQKLLEVNQSISACVGQHQNEHFGGCLLPQSWKELSKIKRRERIEAGGPLFEELQRIQAGIPVSWMPIRWNAEKIAYPSSASLWYSKGVSSAGRVGTRPMCHPQPLKLRLRCSRRPHRNWVGWGVFSTTGKATLSFSRLTRANCRCWNTRNSATKPRTLSLSFNSHETWRIKKRSNSYIVPLKQPLPQVTQKTSSWSAI